MLLDSIVLCTLVSLAVVEYTLVQISRHQSRSKEKVVLRTIAEHDDGPYFVSMVPASKSKLSHLVRMIAASSRLYNYGVCRQDGLNLRVIDRFDSYLPAVLVTLKKNLDWKHTLVGEIEEAHRHEFAEINSNE